MRLVETWCKNTSHKTDTVSAPWFRRRGCSRCGGEIWRRPIHGLERLCSLSVLLPAGLISMVEFRFGDAFIHESFIVTSPFVVFIFAGSGRHFMSGGTSHRIPAFRFGRGIKHRLFWIHFRFARQFPFGLFPIGFRDFLRGTTVDDRQFNRPLAHHFSGDGADAFGIFSQGTLLQWIGVHGSKITAREMSGRCARFSFRACRDPRACRGIGKKCCPVLAALNLARLWPAEIGAGFAGKPAFARWPRIWQWMYSQSSSLVAGCVVAVWLRCGFNSPTGRSLQPNDFHAIDSSDPPKLQFVPASAAA